MKPVRSAVEQLSAVRRASRRRDGREPVGLTTSPDRDVRKGPHRDVRKGRRKGAPLGFSGPCGPKLLCGGIRNPHRSHEIFAETHQKKHVRTVEDPLTIWVHLGNGPTRKKQDPF